MQRNKPRSARGGGGDPLFLLAVLFLALLGIVAVYSASSYNAEVQYGDPFYFVKKQIVGFLLGCGGMAGVSFLEPDRLKKLALPAATVSVLLLLLVFVPGVGKSNYGATRWIGFGGFTVQPSEIAKYGLVLFAAAYFAKDPARMRTLKGALPVLLYGLLLCALVILEPNMSVTMLLAAITVGIVFLAGIPFKTLLLIALPLLLAVPALIVAEPYRLKRLSAFLDPWQSPKGEGYQLIQSLYALANGNFFGTGLFRSRQKYRFLPFAESDFILSVIAEEAGFFGVLLLFLLVGFIVWRGFRIARSCDRFYGYMLASGIMLAFAVQVCLNALVVSGCIPPTGIPFPLVSAGNTSLVVTMTAMGVVYSISRHNGREEIHTMKGEKMRKTRRVSR